MCGQLVTKMLWLLQIVTRSQGSLLCLLIIRMSSHAQQHSQEFSNYIRPEQVPSPFYYCKSNDYTEADDGEFRANVSCESTDQIIATFSGVRNIGTRNNYYAVLHCFNETHHAISQIRHGLRGDSPVQLTGNVSSLFSSENLTCTAIGCYQNEAHDYNGKLQANNCSSTPNPTSSYPSTQDSSSINTSVLSHFSVNAATTSATTFLQVSTALSTITSSHDIMFSINTASYQSLTIPTRQSTPVAAPNNTIPSTGYSTVTNTNHSSTDVIPVPNILILPLFAITTTVTVGLFVTLCLLLMIRQRKTTKRLTNWRTGYGLQVKANISTTDASLTWNFKAPPSPVISVCMPLNYEADSENQSIPLGGSPSTPQSESSTALLHTDCQTEKLSPHTVLQTSEDSSYIKWDVPSGPESNVPLHQSPVVPNTPSASNTNKMTSSAVQKEIAIAPEQEKTNQFYIPSLIYTEGWPIETSGYDALLYSLDGTCNSTENKYQIATSHSMPMLTDCGNYVLAVPYTSIDGINCMEYETSSHTMRVLNGNKEIHCLDMTDTSNNLFPKESEYW